MVTRSYEWCGFCGKAASEVERIIAGPENGICNECVELMHGMLDKPPPREHFISLDEFRQKHGRVRPVKS